MKRNSLDLEPMVKAYMEWENRRKWLLLRSLAYEQIREELKSVEKISSVKLSGGGSIKLSEGEK